MFVTHRDGSGSTERKGKERKDSMGEGYEKERSGVLEKRVREWKKKEGGKEGE